MRIFKRKSGLLRFCTLLNRRRWVRRGLGVVKPSRPWIEILESRTLLAGDLWVVQLDGIVGDTDEERLFSAQTILHDAGLNEDQIIILQVTEPDDKLLIRTPEEMELDELREELQLVPGFIDVSENPEEEEEEEEEAFDPDVDQELGGADLAVGLTGNEPSITVNPFNASNVVVARHHTLKISVDGGVTFPAGLTVNCPLPLGETSYFGDISVAFDSAGHVFATYLTSDNGDDVNVSVAQFDGLTGGLLGSPTVIAAGNLDKEWVAADANPASPFANNVYVIWHDFDQTNAPVRFARSTDNGATWTTMAGNLSGSGQGFTWPSEIAVASNGDVWVAWHTNTTSSVATAGEVRMRRSIDGGVTFGPEIIPFPAGTGSTTTNSATGLASKISGMHAWLQGSVQPRILPDPANAGTLYVVAVDDPDAYDTTNDPSDIVIARSTDNGATWTRSTISAGIYGDIEIMPSAAIDASGRLAVTWYDNRRHLTATDSLGFNLYLFDLFSATSIDGGLTFSNPLPVNDLTNTFDPERGAPDRFGNHTLRIGEYNGLALAEGTAYADWTGNTSTGQQVYFQKFTVPAAGSFQVASTTPSVAGGTFTLPGSFTYDVTFNRAVNPLSVQTTDLSLTGIAGATVTLATVLPGNTTVRFTIGGIVAEGTLSASIAAGAITDAVASPNTAFFGAYQVDAATSAFPAPLTPKNPLGSLIYDPPATGIINFIGDSDTFTLAIDPGQSITVLITPTTGGLRPSVQLRDPADVTIATATAAAAGQNAVIQTAPAATSGIYKIVVSGSTSTVGSYSVQVTLNAALENEGRISGVDDNSLATAQDINPAFVTLSTSQTSAFRGAVTGQVDGYSATALTPSFTDISTTGTISTATGDNASQTLSALQLAGFSFPFFGTTFTSIAFSTNGLITFPAGDTSSSNGDLSTGPSQATVAVLWDDLSNPNTGTQRIYWQVIGSGASQQLAIQWNNVVQSGDTVQFRFQAILSTNGNIQLNYGSAVTTGNVVNSATVGVKAAGTSNPARTLVSFMQAQGPLVGPSLSTLLAPNPADYYKFTLSAGDVATLGVTALATGNLNLELRDSSDSILATGATGATNLTKTINNFTIVTAGTYYARVTGDGNVPYSLVVAKNAAFDRESNDTLATAQPLGNNNGALGSITTTANEDWYSFDVSSSTSPIRIETSTPADGPNQFVNTLNPRIELYSPTNVLLASGSALPDGRNEFILLAPPVALGTYKIRVRSESSTTGEYFVSRRNALFWDPDGNPANNNILTGTGLGGTGNWDTSTAFWFNGITDIPWNNAIGDVANFIGTAGTVSLTTGITAAGLVFGTTGYTIQNNTLTLTGGSVNADLGLSDTIATQIAGSTGLTLTGGGTLVLAADNTYGGITTISSGALQIGNNGSTGSLGTGNVIDNGTLIYRRNVNTTISNVISGSGGLTQLGSQLNLTGANTYTGTTLISSGFLFLGFGTTTGSLSPSSPIIDNAIFGSQRTNTLTQGTNFASVISGTGGVQEFSPNGTLVLNGLNTYSGATTILTGTIRYNSILNVGGGASALGAPTTVNNGTIGIGNNATSGSLVYTGAGNTTDRVINLRGTTGNATLDQSGTGLLKFTSSFTATGAGSKTLLLSGSTTGTAEIAGAIVNNSSTNTTSLTKSGAGTWTLSGSNTYSDTTTISAGTLQVGNAGTTGALGTGAVSDNGSLIFNRTNSLAVSNAISGTGTLTQAGTGTTTLSGANTYSGATTINAGILSVTGSVTSATTVNSGGTLDGTGTTDVINVNTGGALAPGLSPGTIRTGNLILGSGSNYSVEINGSAASGAYDQTGITGTVTLGGNLVLSGTRTDTTADTLTIIDNDGTDGVSGIFAGLPEGSVVQASGVMYSLSYQGGTGNDVTLTSIPAPKVVACSVAPGAILAPGSITIQVTFSKPMKASNLDTSDFSLQGLFHGQIYSLNSFGFSPDGTVLTLNYIGQPDDAYTLTLVAGASGGTNFTDLLGNSLDGEFGGAFPSGNGVAGGNFILNFSKDVDTEPYPVPLTSTAPPGGLIYDPSVSRVIAFAGDTDSYTFAIDAGQTISVLVNQANGGLRPAVELRDPANNLLASASTSVNLQPVFLSAIPTTTSGTYTVTVSGSNSNRGLYVLQVILNSALEAENNGGATNDTAAAAQNIDNSFIALATSNASASRGAVLGGNSASAAWNDFYSLTVAANTKVSVAVEQLTGSGSSFSIENGSGTVLGTGVAGATNYDLGISSHLIATAGTYYLHVSGAAATTYSAVIIKNGAFETEGNDTFATAKDITAAGGVLGAIVPKSGPTAGSTTVPNNLASVEGNSNTPLPFAQASSHVQQIYSASQFASGGIIDAIRFRRNSTQGPFTTNGLVVQVDLAYAATPISAASGTFANNIGGGDLTVYSGPLTLSSIGSSGSGPNPFDVVIDVANLFDYNPALGDLLLDIRVTGNASQSFLLDAANASQQSDVVRIYNLNVTNQGGNVGGANDGAPYGLVTQFDFVAPASESDWYSINVASLSPNLRLETSTPSDGPNQFLNTLNPHLELYDPAGNLVASGTALADGRNESLQFHAPGLTPGTYRVRLTGDGSTTWGEYFLGASTLPNQSPTAVDDAPVVANEDTPALISVLTNDSDPDGFLDTTTVSIGALPAHGSVSVNPTTGQITYTPSVNYSGPDSFTYTVKDDSGAISNIATINLTVVAVADPPALNFADAAGAEASAIPLSIAAALTDTDGSEALSIQISSVPALAQLSAGTNQGGGVWTLVPVDLPGLTISYPDDASFFLTVIATAKESSNADQASTMGSIFVNVNNVAPSSIVLNSGAINETDTFALSGSFVDQGTLDTHTVVITWGPGEGSTTFVLPAGVLTFSASHPYLDDNPSGSASDDYPISVTVTDDDTGSASATSHVTVNNVAPTATPNGYSTSQAMAIPGSVITDNTGAGADGDNAGTNDPLVVYAVNGITGNVGQVIATSNGTVIVNADGTFTYTPDSTFFGTDSFTYEITDGDFGNATATVTIIVSAAAPGSILTIPDSCLGGTALLVTGTSANDTIVVEPGSNSSTLKVTFNGVSTTIAKPSGRIIVTGGNGDDNIQIAGAIANPVWLYGDAGNDRLNAGNGGSLLIGGDGNDQLLGGGGRDVMIGGEGADHLVGNSDDDILVAGFTVQDSRSSLGHDDFWCQVLDEWNSGDSFASRVQNLHPVLMSVVHDDDFIDAVDFLNGSAGNDWLIFRNGEDKVAGQAEATN
jgi:autotransporter-associated beta strand protein